VADVDVLLGSKISQLRFFLWPTLLLGSKISQLGYFVVFGDWEFCGIWVWDLGILQEFCVCGLGNWEFCGLIFFVDFGTVCLGFRLWVLSSFWVWEIRNFEKACQFLGLGNWKLEIGNPVASP
jgi:hypothetical protein